MAKLADLIRATLKDSLAPNEELRSVGQATSGSLGNMIGALILTTILVCAVPFLVHRLMPPWIGVAIVFAVTTFYALRIKNWWIGVTNERVLIARVTVLGRPTRDLFAVPLQSVQLTKNGMSLVYSVQGLSQSFRFFFGAKWKTGLDLQEFWNELARARSSSRT